MKGRWHAKAWRGKSTEIGRLYGGNGSQLHNRFWDRWHRMGRLGRGRSRLCAGSEGRRFIGRPRAGYPAGRYRTAECAAGVQCLRDRKSTRLNSSHLVISYAVFCLKKKKKKTTYNGYYPMRLTIIYALR